jgi:hypothetical protein
MAGLRFRDRGPAIAWSVSSSRFRSTTVLAPLTFPGRHEKTTHRQVPPFLSQIGLVIARRRVASKPCPIAAVNGGEHAANALASPNNADFREPLAIEKIATGRDPERRREAKACNPGSHSRRPSRALGVSNRRRRGRTLDRRREGPTRSRLRMPRECVQPPSGSIVFLIFSGALELLAACVGSFKRPTCYKEVRSASGKAHAPWRRHRQRPEWQAPKPPSALYSRMSLRFSSNSALSISPLAKRSFKISIAREAVSRASGSSRPLPRSPAAAAH